MSRLRDEALPLLRKGVIAVAAGLLAACAALPAPDAAEKATIDRVLIRNVTIIPMDVAGSVPGQDVLVSGGRIVAIGGTGSVKARQSDRIIEGAGKYLMPGLWDMHVHSTMPEGPAALSNSMPLYLSYGVVGVRDMGAKPDALPALKRRSPSNDGLPEIVAAGPVLDGPKRPWQQKVALPLADVAAVQQAVRELARAGVDFLKPYDGLSPEQYAALAAAAREAGLTLAGHVPLGMTVEQVSTAGQKSVEHAGLKLAADCMPEGQKAVPAMLNAWIKQGYEGKFEESLNWWSRRDVAACKALFSRLAQRGTWVTPTLGFEIKGGPWTTAAELADLTPELLKACESDLSSIAAAGKEARESHYNHVFQQVRDLHRAGVPLLAGSDVPNTCLSHGRSLHRELRLLRKAGLSNWEALKTATLNPARYLGRNDEGVVRRGAVANLLLLDADPLVDVSNTTRIGGVMLRGTWRGRADLARLRALKNGK